MSPKKTPKEVDCLRESKDSQSTILRKNRSEDVARSIADPPLKPNAPEKSVSPTKKPLRYISPLPNRPVMQKVDVPPVNKLEMETSV